LSLDKKIDITLGVSVTNIVW